MRPRSATARRVEGQLGRGCATDLFELSDFRARSTRAGGTRCHRVHIWSLYPPQAGEGRQVALDSLRMCGIAHTAGAMERVGAACAPGRRPRGALGAGGCRCPARRQAARACFRPWPWCGVALRLAEVRSRGLTIGPAMDAPQTLASRPPHVARGARRGDPHRHCGHRPAGAASDAGRRRRSSCVRARWVRRARPPAA